MILKGAFPKVVRRAVDLGGLSAFFEHFWPTLEPGPFSHSWHIDAIADHLQACQNREILELVINVPPGSGKTKLVSCLWPAYVWTQEPTMRFITATYSDTLGTRNAENQRIVCGSDLYRHAFPEFKPGRMAQEPVKFYKNGSGGFRFSTTPEGAATGNHAHTHIADDPNKAKDAAAVAVSPKALEDVLTWWDGTMATRRIPGEPLIRVLVMQRLHAKDLAGICLDRGYAHLCVPARYAPNAFWDRGSPIPKRDPRTEPGEIYWSLISEAEMAKKEKDLGSPSAVSSQLQQNPNPEKGGIIEREWLQRWTELPTDPSKMRFIQVWDFASKSNKPKHSRTHGALWAVYQEKAYLIDEVIGMWNYPTAKKVFLACQLRTDLNNLVKIGKISQKEADVILKIRKSLRHPKLWALASRPIVEEKANGIALLQDLNGAVRCKPVNPKESKEDRIVIHADRFETGCVYMPSKEWLDTVDDFENELVYFPRWGWDDRVDTTSSALDELFSKYAKIKAAING